MAVKGNCCRTNGWKNELKENRHYNISCFIIIFNGATLNHHFQIIAGLMNNYPAAIKLNFVDDLSVALKINLHKAIIHSTTHPERFGMAIFVTSNNMKRVMYVRQMDINGKKSNIIKFSSSTWHVARQKHMISLIIL